MTLKRLTVVVIMIAASAPVSSTVQQRVTKRYWITTKPRCCWALAHLAGTLVGKAVGSDVRDVATTQADVAQLAVH